MHTNMCMNKWKEGMNRKRKACSKGQKNFQKKGKERGEMNKSLLDEKLANHDKGNQKNILFLYRNPGRAQVPGLVIKESQIFSRVQARIKLGKL